MKKRLSHAATKLTISFTIFAFLAVTYQLTKNSVEAQSCQNPPVIGAHRAWPPGAAGNGFDMTSAQNGVMFRPEPNSPKIQTAWTRANSDDAWLALDRNGNGKIDDGSELFGCAAPQPAPPPGEIGNGFIALAEYDKPSKGGNSDGQIDFRDDVFTQLKLWQDDDHNGKSRAGELQRLSNSVIRVIELDYRLSKKQDAHGNKFKYRARVRDVHGAQAGRWAWDVFPVTRY